MPVDTRCGDDSSIFDPATTENMASTTIGNALNRAIALCAQKYQGIAIYGASVIFHETRGVFVIELQAEHFSQRLRYEVAP